MTATLAAMSAALVAVGIHAELVGVLTTMSSTAWKSATTRRLLALPRYIQASRIAPIRRVRYQPRNAAGAIARYPGVIPNSGRCQPAQTTLIAAAAVTGFRTRSSTGWAKPRQPISSP
jgi:hypothetical protein